MIKNEHDLVQFIENDTFIMNALRAAQSLGLPQWFLGAGIIRNTVWDIQHGRTPNYDYNDIDLGYYDFENQSDNEDQRIARNLGKTIDVNWEVVNQAYAHKYNDVPPYISAVDGLAHWVETATAVGATIDKSGRVLILAPWGVNDLLELKLRLCPCHAGNEYYEKLFAYRVSTKDWLKKWSLLKVTSN